MSTMANWTLERGMVWIHSGRRVHVSYRNTERLSLCGRWHYSAPLLDADQAFSIDPTPVCRTCERVLEKWEATP